MKPIVPTQFRVCQRQGDTNAAQISIFKIKVLCDSNLIDSTLYYSHFPKGKKEKRTLKTNDKQSTFCVFAEDRNSIFRGRVRLKSLDLKTGSGTFCNISCGPSQWVEVALLSWPLSCYNHQLLSFHQRQPRTHSPLDAFRAISSWFCPGPESSKQLLITTSSPLRSTAGGGFSCLCIVSSLCVLRGRLTPTVVACARVTYFSVVVWWVMVLFHSLHIRSNGLATDTTSDLCTVTQAELVWFIWALPSSSLPHSAV